MRREQSVFLRPDVIGRDLHARREAMNLTPHCGYHDYPESITSIALIHSVYIIM